MINGSLKFILTDCTAKDLKKLKKIEEFLSNGKFWQEEFGPQIFIGYNPFLNGRTKEIRGCGNNCVTCDFTNILTDLNYINNVTFDKISFLIQGMVEKDNEDLRNIFKVNKLRFKIADYPHLRISGGIQGDPLMTDEKIVYKLIKILNKNFPKAFISIDTTANLRLLSLKSLKLINDCGLNQINVSVNCSTEPTYASFFNLTAQEAKKRFNIMKENIKNIDKIGIKLSFSYVYGFHSDNSEECIKNIPKFMADGQSQEAINNFVKLLQLNQKPKLRLWPIYATKNTIDRLREADIGYLLKK